MERDEFEIAFDLAHDISELLTGAGPVVQGATLAILTARWVAGFRKTLAGDACFTDLPATERLRAGVVAGHTAAIMRIIPIEERGESYAGEA